MCNFIQSFFLMAKNLKILILFALFWLPLYCVAQSYSEEIGQSLQENDILKLLPPLQALIDSAVIHSPLLKISDSDLIIRRLSIDSEKREWLRNVGFESGARYGLFDNLIITEDLGMEDLKTSATVQSRYSVGVFLKIPLSVLIDRSNVKIAREQMNQAKYQRDQTIIELRKLIISHYYEVVKVHKRLIINNETVEIYRVQMFRAEEDFKNGAISVTEYSRLKNIFTQSILALEETKVDFLIALQLLEEIAGTKIELKESGW
jgi:outer membrane protein TolC